MTIRDRVGRLLLLSLGFFAVLGLGVLLKDPEPVVVVVVPVVPAVAECSERG